MANLKIGKLARLGNVNIETIRYYERIGLIPDPPRSRAGYRIYSSETVNRVHFIKRAKHLGFSLKEIRDLLALRITPDGKSEEVLIRAKAKIEDIEQKIATLRSMKRSLQQLTLACTGKAPVCDCPILENLSAEEAMGK